MLKDKVILITGGGSGIGAATASIASGRGARLVITDIDGDAAEAVARSLVEKGGEAVAMRVDIASEEDAAAQVAFAIETFGRLDGAYNNAGNNLPEALMHEHSADKFRHVVNVNLVGTWLCMKYQIPAMLEHGGAIVVNASDAGKAGTPRFTPYAATKAGIINMVQTAAVEYAGQRIRFNAVCPGPIRTAPVAAVLEHMGVDESYFLGGLPMKRFGEPGEVGELVTFLLSDAASYVTGQAVSVDGGLAASFS